MMNSWNFSGFPQQPQQPMQGPSYGSQQPMQMSMTGFPSGPSSMGTQMGSASPQMLAQALLAPSGTGGAMQRQAPRTGGNMQMPFNMGAFGY
jgi:hypothetical protein